MEYYENKLAVSYPELVPEFITKATYSGRTSRGTMIRLRRGSVGHHALIEFSCLPTELQKKLLDKYGMPDANKLSLDIREPDNYINPETLKVFVKYLKASGIKIREDRTTINPATNNY